MRSLRYGAVAADVGLVLGAIALDDVGARGRVATVVQNVRVVEDGIGAVDVTAVSPAPGFPGAAKAKSPTAPPQDVDLALVYRTHYEVLRRNFKHEDAEPAAFDWTVALHQSHYGSDLATAKSAALAAMRNAKR